MKKLNEQLEKKHWLNVTGAVALIKIHGPSRVLVSSEPYAVSSRRAREHYGVEPDLIFIRNDGWSLGAPKSLIFSAEALWEKQWVAVLIRPSLDPVPYSEWIKNGRPTEV